MDPHPHFEEAPKHRRRRRKSNQQLEGKHGRHVGLTRIIGGALVAVALLAAFLAGRETRPLDAVASRPETKTIVTVDKTPDTGLDTPERRNAMKMFERGLVLFSEGKLSEAREAFGKTREIDPSFPGIHYQLARVLAAENSNTNAVLLVDKSLRANEEILECYLLKAQLYAREKQIEGALKAYTLAAQAAPSSVDPFFEWGELLRRIGKRIEAVEKLQQASVRAAGQAEYLVVSCKLLLAQVEAENADWIENELQPRLAEEEPPVEWLLAGAAHAIQEKNWTRAREYLEAARTRMPQGYFNWYVRDGFFDFHRSNPELSDLLSPMGKRPQPAKADDDTTP
jgi:tetratricopeptide (TPR) repeat protein